MKATTVQVTSPTFLKTDVPCLYRYSSNGIYYALVKQKGKQKRASLETTDKAVAKRKLGDLQRDLGKTDASQGRVTLRELCDRYLPAIADAAAKTVKQKTSAIRHLLEDSSLGPDCQVSKIKPSDLQRWIASYSFGYASYNLYAQVLRDLFNLAVADKVLANSPAHGITSKRVITPIRTTPSFEEFRAIIDDVRGQICPRRVAHRLLEYPRENTVPRGDRFATDCWRGDAHCSAERRLAALGSQHPAGPASPVKKLLVAADVFAVSDNALAATRRAAGFPHTTT